MKIFNPEIAFDGWAIAILIFILSSLGIGTFMCKTKNKIFQKQKGGKGAEQKQKVSEKTIKDHNDISQSQKAGDNAKQKQKI